MSKKVEKDLYKILGIPRKATANLIKKTYRNLVKKHHPDLGGDSKKFRQIEFANSIISNPERRVLYDETGTYEEVLVLGAMSILDHEANRTIAEMYQSLIRDLLGKGQTSFPNKDIIQAMRDHAQKELGKANTKLQQFESYQILYNQSKDRIVTVKESDELNIFDGVINQLEEADRKAMERINDIVAIWDRILILLEAYKYDGPIDQQPQMSTASFSVTFTS